MTAADDAHALARVRWLVCLEPKALLALAGSSRRRVIARDEVLWTQGEFADAVAVIVRGRVDVVRATADGRRMLLRSLGPGDSAGLSSLARMPHSAHLVAGAKSTVLLVPGDALRAAIRAHPDIVLGALAQMSETIAKLSDELEETRYLDLDERLRRVLARRAHGLREIQITHDELAQQVGATRENVSRALKRMQLARAIVCRRGRIEILSLAAGRPAVR